MRSRIIFFLIASLALQIARTYFVAHFFNLKISTPDKIFTHFFYIVSALALLVLWRELGYKKFSHPDRHHQIFFTVAAIAITLIPLSSVGHDAFTVIITDFFIQACACAALARACFNFDFFKTYKLEILFIAQFSALMKLLSFFIEDRWHQLSFIVIRGVGLLLHILPVEYQILIEQENITVKNFGVVIGPLCSGVSFLSAFIALLFFSILIHRKQNVQFNSGRIALVIFGGCVIGYVANIIRIVLILLVGAYYSPEFAVSTFHASIGSLLFITIFIFYITKSVQWAKKSTIKSS